MKSLLHLPTILRLKKRGNGYREIGLMIGKTGAAVHHMVKRGLPDLHLRCPECLQRRGR